MFQRIKNLIALSRKDPQALEEAMQKIEELPDANDSGAFLGEGTHEEFVKQQQEDEGMSAWYERLKRL